MYLPLGRVGVVLDFFWMIRQSLRKVGNAAVRIHTMKSSLIKPLFSGSVGSSSYTGTFQFTGLLVPKSNTDQVTAIPHTKSLAQFSRATLKRNSEVIVSTRIPKLHMLVCPPSNALLHQWNRISCAIGINIKQLQRVCKEKKETMIKTQYKICILNYCCNY